jgi:hypothetical protein
MFFGLSSTIYIFCAHLDIFLCDAALALTGVLHNDVRVPSTLGLQLQEFLHKQTLKSVLRIHDILVWIRIRIWIHGSMPLTNGSGCGSGCYASH